MKTRIFLIVAVFLSQIAFSQGYKIKVQIKGLENQRIILGHHKGNDLIPNDTVILDKKAFGVFQGKEKLRKGLYFIFLPSRTYFDFLIGDDQEFSIYTDTTDIIKNLKIEGSLDNQIFLKYQDFFFEKNKKIKELQDQLSKTEEKEDKQKIEKQIKDLIKEIEDYSNEIEKKYPNLYVTKFIKATEEVKLPEDIKDPKAKYYYFRNHYFDNFNYADPDLYYTPFYFSKIDYYLDKVLPQIPDTLIAEIDKILNSVKEDDEVYKNLLTHLYNKYARSQLMIAENIYVHIAEIFVDYADWIPKSRLDKIRKNINRKKNCLIGMKAHNMVLYALPSDSLSIEKLRPYVKELRKKGLEIEKDTTRTFEEKLPELSLLIQDFLDKLPKKIELDTVKAQYTILWFMSPSCSHCRRETPLFYKKYQEVLKDKNVKVITIYLEKNTDDWRKFSSDLNKWLDFIQEHKFYQWYNTWNPFANYRFFYDIQSSPVLYLLDENKQIIAKRIGYEQAIELILKNEKKDE